LDGDVHVAKRPMHAIIRRPDGAWANAGDCKVTGEGTAITLTASRANGGAAMVCYCCCPVPYDAQYTCWLAVFATPMQATDTPMHADDLPFPLFLPLYPARDLVLLAFRARRGAEAAPPTVYMHFPPPKVLAVLAPLRLTVDLWKRAAGAWHAALKALSIGSWLAYAFDSLWALADPAAAEDEMYVEQDCATDDDDEAPVPATQRPATAPDAASTSSGDEDADEDADGGSEDANDYFSEDSMAEEGSEDEDADEDADADEEEEDDDGDADEKEEF
jgi:hypothetical protein